MTTPIIYIIYNARASLLGKLHYGYRKATTSADSDSPCAACDLTHGGIHLTETKQWTATKARIGAEVQQLHQDELNEEIIDFVAQHQLRYPLVLGRRGALDAPLALVMEAKDLQGCEKSHEEFVQRLGKNAAAMGITVEIAPPAEVH